MYERPGRDDLREAATRLGLPLAEAELDAFTALAGALSGPLERLEARAEEVRTCPDRGARRPAAGEDPLNAVIHWCAASGAEDGPLAGVRVGLKDNMQLAGVPMTCGSRLLDGFVPDLDCVVAERLLAAGASVVAKLNLENLALSGGGETSAYGPVRNPFDPDRTASGSSGGSAAALFLDGIDLTFGTDQGGSVRLPASWCGTLGLKPTYGLVPYTGIVGLDPALDHVGPLARTVELLARGLEAVAGLHPSDPRQPCEVPAGGYVGAVEAAPEQLDGVRLGLLREGTGFTRPGAPEGTAETEQAFHEAVERLAGLGAAIDEVSVPEHRTGGSVMFAHLVDGVSAALRGIDTGTSSPGARSPALQLHLGTALRERPGDLPPTAVAIALLGEHVRATTFGALAARARNLAPGLAAAYDAALAGVDVLVTPTATYPAHHHDAGAALVDHVLRGWGMVANTAPFDVTGHPAISVPLAEAGGLPVGVQLVGRRFDDARLLSLARTIERALGWQPARQSC